MNLKDKPLITKRKVVALLLTITLLTSAFYVLTASNGGGATYITSGSFAEDYSYLISWKNGTHIQVKNGTTGTIDYESSDVRATFKSTVESLTNGGTVCLGRGTYDLAETGAGNNTEFDLTSLSGDIIFQGEEPSATILRSKGQGEGGYGVNFTDDGWGGHRIYFRDLKLSGSSIGYGFYFRYLQPILENVLILTGDLPSGAEFIKSSGSGPDYGKDQWSQVYIDVTQTSDRATHPVIVSLHTDHFYYDCINVYTNADNVTVFAIGDSSTFGTVHWTVWGNNPTDVLLFNVAGSEYATKVDVGTLKVNVNDVTGGSGCYIFNINNASLANIACAYLYYKIADCLSINANSTTSEGVTIDTLITKVSGILRTGDTYGTIFFDNNSSVTFNHGLISTPILVQASFNVTGWGTWAWNATSTQLTIQTENNVNATCYWKAKYRP